MSIGTTLEIYDKMTAPLRSITSSLEQTINSLETMENTMNTPVDMDFDSTNKTLQAVRGQMDALRKNVSDGLPEIKVPVVIDDSQLRTDFLDQWQGQSMEIFTNTGVDRFNSELSSAISKVSELNSNQINIAENADIQFDTNLQDITTQFDNFQNQMLNIPDMEIITKPLDLAPIESQLNSLPNEQELEFQVITRGLDDVTHDLNFIEADINSMPDLDIGMGTLNLDGFNNELDNLESNIYSIPDIAIDTNATDLSGLNSDIGAIEDGIYSIPDLDIGTNDVMTSMNEVQNRLQDIEKMTIEYSEMDIDIDVKSNGIEKVRQDLESIERQQNDLNNAMADMDVTAANRAYEQLNKTISGTEKHLRDNIAAQDQFTNEVVDSTSAFDGLRGMAMKLGGVLLSGKFLKGGLDRLMGVDTAQAKLMALGHTAEGVASITNNALDSVTGTAFKMEEAVTTAASAVAAGIKPGQQLEHYLSLVADTAAIAGSSMSEMGSIFNKVATDGRVMTQELNQLGDRGIPIIQMLADELGVTSTQVREMASAGEISAQQFLNAVDKGFGGAAQIMGEASLDAIIDNISSSLGRMSANFLNGAGDGKGFFDTVKPMLVDLLDWMRSIEKYFMIVGQVVGELFNHIVSLVSNVANAFVKYWGMIQPLIMGIVTALGLYVGYMVISNTITAINTGIQTAQAIALAVKTGATIAEAAATQGLTIAQWALNSALLASPITWVVLGIIALVVVIYTAIAAVNHFAGTSISATGLIAGAFAWLGAFIVNVLITVVNIGIQIINLLVMAFHTGVWLIQVAFYALGLALVIILDLIVNTGILAVNLLVNAWNFGVFAIQMAFIGLITLVLLIFDGILNGGIMVVELLANAWNIGIFGIQMAWIGLNILVRSVLQAILNFGISVAEGFANGWNDAIFGLQTAFYKFQQFVAKVMQAVGQGAIGVVNAVLSGISSLVNTAIGGLNNLIGMANNIPGVNISAIGTVDLQVGQGIQSFVDDIGSGISAPVRAQQVSLNRSTMADDYSPEIPSMPEMVSFDRSSLATDFLGSIDIPKMPKWEDAIDYPSLTDDYIGSIDFPEFPKLEQTLDLVDYVDMGSWFDAGYDWGENLAQNMKDFSLTDAISDALGIEDIMGGMDDIGDMGDTSELEELLGGGAGGLGDDAGGGGGLGDKADKATGGTSAADKAAKELGKIADNTDEIKDNTGMSKDDLKYLRDLNSRKAVNRVISNEFNINLDNTNQVINQEQDLDGVVDYLAKGVQQAVDSSVEGEYS